MCYSHVILRLPEKSDWRSKRLFHVEAQLHLPLGDPSSQTPSPEVTVHSGNNTSDPNPLKSIEVTITLSWSNWFSVINNNSNHKHNNSSHYLLRAYYILNETKLLIYLLMALSQ